MTSARRSTWTRSRKGWPNECTELVSANARERGLSPRAVAPPALARLPSLSPGAVVSSRKFETSVQVAVRIPAPLLSLADELAREMSTEAMPITRSDALRIALRVGLDKIAAREGVTLPVTVDPSDP